jgi:hypothetical protein
VPVRVATRTPESSFREVLRHTLTEAVEGLKLGDVGDLVELFGAPKRTAPKPEIFESPIRRNKGAMAGSIGSNLSIIFNYLATFFDLLLKRPINL